MHLPKVVSIVACVKATAPLSVGLKQKYETWKNKEKIRKSEWK